MIKAAIFDMDGLLIDSEPFWRASHIAALATHDVTITQDDVRHMAGKRTDEVVEHWRQQYGLQHISGDALEAEISAHVIENVRLNGLMLPGVQDTIAMFEAHHIPMAVASSSAPDVIAAVLDKLQLAGHMREVYSAKYEDFGKPHPGVFLTTAQKLDVSPVDCLVFEDSLSGVRAAKSAGMKCIAVPEAANLDKPEFSQEADLVIASLKQLRWDDVESLFA